MNDSAAFTMSVVAVLLCLGLPFNARAQERKGFWVGGGVGAGTLGGSRDDVAAEREAIGVGYFNVGWSLDRHLSFGFEISVTSRNRGGGDWEGSDDVSGTVTYYPRSASGFFVKGGAGASELYLDIVDEFGTHALITLGTGFGVIAGTGWDVGRRFWLTPAVHYRYGHPGDLVMAGRVVSSNWKHQVVDVTIGVKFD